MSSERISRWARRFLLVSGLFLVSSQVAVLAGAPRAVEVVLGLYGFVLTTVFGKAYSLVPTYFDRKLAWSYAPAVHLPLATAGVLALAAARWPAGPDALATAGPLLWGAGVAVFLLTIAATIRDNPTGAETATGDAAADRQPLDRLANAFVPVALAYLAAGSYDLVARTVGLPTLLDGLSVRISHLLGPGFALVLFFAVGYRLLPRFLVVRPTRSLAAVVLPAGAVGPALLAWGYPAGTVFELGAVAESVAVVGFAITYIRLFLATDRDRVGFYGPLAGVCLGTVGVALGAYFAFEGIDAALALAHLRVNVYGLLGVTIVGVVYQFYPPAVGQWPGATDRTAVATIGALAAGVALAAFLPVLSPASPPVGHLLALAGALGYCYLLAATIRFQTSRRR